MDNRIKIKEGDYVFYNKIQIKLIREIGNGEEGIIYITDSNFVCKIYKENSLNDLKYLKLRYMLKMNVKDKGICWPLAVVSDVYGNYAGYLMINANGKKLKDSIFNKKILLSQFPNWKKRDLIILTLSILNKIKYLHNKGVILGDINTENILVKSSMEVYFVDTDSYQIYGIPCPVGTEVFTAPEIREPVYSKYLRSFGNEYFAVAVLVFMIMMMGIAPYGGDKSIEIARNLKSMKFIYPLNIQDFSKKNGDESLYTWSHLPYFLREAFYHTFNRGGRRSGERSRYTTAEWIILMNKYLALIDTGYIKEEDIISEDIYPYRFKL